MNFKKTIFLGLVLVASILYLTKIAIPSKDREMALEQAFATLDTAKIVSLKIVREATANSAAETFEIVNPTPSDSATQLPKSAAASDADDSEAPPSPDSASLKKWEIASLRGAALDSSTLSAMITALREMKVGTGLANSEVEKDISVYGLSKPPLTLVLHRRGSDPVEIAIGKKNEYLGKRYVKISGRQEIFLVDDAVFTTLNKGTADIRDRSPLKFEDPDVREVTVTSDKGSVKVSQISAGEWSIVEPEKREASTIAVGELLRSVKDLRVSEFIDGKDIQSPEFGLAKPGAVISVSFREGAVPASLVVKVGRAPADKAPADSSAKVPSKGTPTAGSEDDTNSPIYFSYSGGPSVLKTLSDPLPSLALDVDALRERRIFRFNSGDVAKLEVSGSAVAPITITANNTDWKVNNKAADPAFVEQVLDTITGVRISEFVKDQSGDFGFDKPHLKFVITKKPPSADVLTLTIGRDVEGKGGTSFFARLGESGEVVLIKEDDLKKMSPREETLVMITTPTPAPSTPPAPAQ